MNEIKKLTLRERIQNAIKAFKGSQIGSLQLGVDVKRCDQCEYKNNELRDNLLVTAGCRAVHMDMRGAIDIPQGVDAEADSSYIIAKLVDRYLLQNDVNFDLFIESGLMQKYGGNYAR